jgi:hypothetical protein
MAALRVAGLRKPLGVDCGRRVHEAPVVTSKLKMAKTAGGKNGEREADKEAWLHGQKFVV